MVFGPSSCCSGAALGLGVAAGESSPPFALPDPPASALGRDGFADWAIFPGDATFFGIDSFFGWEALGSLLGLGLCLLGDLDFLGDGAVLGEAF